MFHPSRARRRDPQASTPVMPAAVMVTPEKIYQNQFSN
jgi:hypothetical protein